MSDPAISELFARGIRAARQGKKEPAQKILLQVVAAEPSNELAWLWLARVTDDKKDKAASLQQALELNPDNRWASNELAMLRGEVPAGTDPFGETKAKAEQLSCPNCGGGVALKLDCSKTVVCQFCDSVVDLTPDQAAIVGKRKGQKKAVPIELGDKGTFGGTEHEVIGWLQFKGEDDEDTWFWEEWLLADDVGGYKWLTWDDEDGFSLQRRLSITGALRYGTKKIDVEGGQAQVIDRGSGKIMALDGELTWRAKVGDRMRYMDARRGKTGYSVEFSEDEVELYEATPLSIEGVSGAFNKPGLVDAAKSAFKGKPKPKPQVRRKPRAGRRHSAIAAPLHYEEVAESNDTLIFFIMVVIMIIVIGWFLFSFGCSSSRGGGGGYYYSTGGVSVRGGSVGPSHRSSRRRSNYRGGSYRGGK